MSDHSYPSSETLDLDAIHSRITELREIYGSSNDVPEEMTLSVSEELLKDCALQLTSKINQVLSEYSDVGALAVDDLDAYLGQLKEDLNSVEVQNTKISSEIEDLMETYVEDSHRLESELEGLYCSLDSIASPGIEKGKAEGRVDCPAHGEGELSNAKEDYKFKMLKLSHQIENNKITLKSLQDLDCTLKRYEAVEKIEDALTGLKVMEFDGNRIRLTLRTYIPTSESLLSQHKIEDITEPLECNHELVIEILEGTLELKSVEGRISSSASITTQPLETYSILSLLSLLVVPINVNWHEPCLQVFPNDVYIGELIDATKSFRAYRHMAVLEAEFWTVVGAIRRRQQSCFGWWIDVGLCLTAMGSPATGVGLRWWDPVCGGGFRQAGGLVEVVLEAESLLCLCRLVERFGRHFFSTMSLLEMRSPLEWFVRRVQDRIVLCTLRRLLVKFANKSRHSFEYIDRDEIIVAHMVGGVDAFIKMSQGWPVSNNPLKLISLKSSSQYSKEISLSFLCKVEEVANSLDVQIRQNISSFVDAVEKILMQQTRAELQSDNNSES
ncbi:hypothetical protein RHSIM_RhsimUnG0035600 [Rhododendron simsii]|uniref:Uncharacterized protein n=1 Tax=Rhododendron simsii TaxID=118357 RepID=A0A834L5Q2_RHOSS|nr:hypothetical protein RHSIM_RhsimUnG0035600 [Rhododendron simsii]